MPNYWITTNAKFRPFSYDEMIRPVEKMYTEHSKVEEGLAELQTKAGIWEGLANKESDPETYAQYKRYADELRLAANELATQGLTATSRRNLYSMKARYANEITPIEQAYTKREKLAEEQRKLNAQSGFNTRFDNDFSTISLDKLVANPQLSYTGINGDEVVKRTSAMASSIAKAISRMPEFVTSPNAEVNKQYFMQKLQQGATIEEVLSEITGDKDAPKELSMIRQTIKSQLADNPAYDENWVNSLINQGMFSAIGSASYDLVNNKGYSPPLEWANYNLSKRRVELDEADYANRTTPVATDLQDDKGNTVMFDPSRRMYYTLRSSGKDNVGNRVYRPSLGSGTSGGKIIPEVDKDGKPTGRNYDTKLRKYLTDDGNLHQDQSTHAGSNVHEAKTKTFPGLYYHGAWNTHGAWGQSKWPDVGSGGDQSTDFDPNDSNVRLKDVSKLSESNRVGLAQDLGMYGLTLDDIEIWEDMDVLSNNEYKVVPKGKGKYWMPNAPKSGTATSSGSTNDDDELDPT